MRSPLESLLPGIEVHILVISAWADLLNYEEKFKLKGSIARLFCSVNMLVRLIILELQFKLSTLVILFNTINLKCRMKTTTLKMQNQEQKRSETTWNRF